MIDYNPNAGIIISALRIRGTVISLVIQRPGFYILLFFHVGLSASHKMEYFMPDQYHMDIAMGMTGVTGSLMTFFVVFYNGNVFSRYNKLYELTKNMIEFTMYSSSLIVREIKDHNLARKMCRMVLASNFLFFFERTPDEDDDAIGAISAEEWTQLHKFGLIDSKEMELLHEHCRRLGDNAIPSWMLLHWAMRLYRAQGIGRLNELEKSFWTIRRCQDDVVEIMEMPMPFQYFHIMNMMMLLNLSLWAYALALEDSYFATLIFLFVQMVFLGIRELSVAMSDPYGDDEADFPLDDWMTQLYVRVNSLCEDTWEQSKFLPLKHVRALPHLSDKSVTHVKHLLIASSKKVAGKAAADDSGEESGDSAERRVDVEGREKGEKGRRKEEEEEEEKEEEEEEDDDD